MASSSSRGQSLPYPSAARIADGQCYPQYTASLKCLEEFNKEKSRCQKHFDVYKECKKKEESWTRGKLDWSAIGIDPCSHETCLKNYEP